MATLEAELSWRKEDFLATLPTRTHDLPCEERVLIAGKELCGIMTLLEKLEASCTIRVACASDSLLKEFRHEKQPQRIHVASGLAVDNIVFEWSDGSQTGCAGFTRNGQPKDLYNDRDFIVAPALKMLCLGNTFKKSLVRRLLKKTWGKL